MSPEAERSAREPSETGNPVVVSDIPLFLARGVDRDSIAQRLKHLSPDMLRIAEYSDDAVLAALENGAAPIIVAAQAPRAIARAIAQGARPSEALADWHRAVAGILKLQRGNRRRILLVSEGYLLQASGEEAQALSDRLSLQDAVPVEMQPVDPFSLCLATMAIQASPEAVALAATLEASSLSQADATLDLAEIDSVFATAQAATEHQKDLRDRLDLAVKSATARETAQGDEQALFRAQLEQLQSEIVALVETEATLQNRLAAAEQESTARQKTLSEAQSRAEAALEAEKKARAAAQSKAEAALEAERKARAAAQKETAELRRTLEQNRATDERQTRDMAAAAGREGALTKELTLFRAQLEQLQSEIVALSERETTLQDRLATAGRESAAKQHALTATQAELGGMRKALELADKRHARLRDESAGAEDRVLTQFNQIKRLGRELAQSRTRLAEAEALARQSQDRERELNDRVSEIEAEYSKVLMSRSWNVTKPLRAMNRVVSPTSDRKK